MPIPNSQRSTAAMTAFALKQTLRIGLVAFIRAASRALLVVTIGVSLNLCGLWLLRPELHSLVEQVGGLPGARVAGANPVALLLVVVVAGIAYWKVLTLILLFALGFPVAFWILGQRYGIEVALLRLWQSHRELLLSRIARGLHAFIARRGAERPTTDSTEPTPEFSDLVSRYLRRLDDVPRVIRGPVRQLLKLLGFEAMIKQFYAANQNGSVDAEALTQAAFRWGGAALEERLLQPRLNLLLWLASTNIVLLGLLKWWL